MLDDKLSPVFLLTVDVITLCRSFVFIGGVILSWSVCIELYKILAIIKWPFLRFIVSDAFDANFGVGILRVTKGLDVSSYISEDELIQACKYRCLCIIVPM